MTHFRSAALLAIGLVFGGLTGASVMLDGGPVYVAVWALSAGVGVAIALLLRRQYTRWVRRELTGRADGGEDSRAQQLTSAASTLGLLGGAVAVNLLPSAAEAIISIGGGFLLGFALAAAALAVSVELAVARDAADGSVDAARLEPTVGVKFQRLPAFHKVLWIAGIAAWTALLCFVVVSVWLGRSAPAHRTMASTRLP